mmetsp:Transcript_10814/g.39655  ORF Transcript_10814/g.39655 Transcript_10814/m.39655 type:complete len:205 (+) Transcript_10814:955-1569(+)
MQGCITLIVGLCGLPPPNGAIPQSPLHVRSLRGVGEKDSHSSARSQQRVLEQRLSNLLQSIFVGICLFLAPVLSLIPRSLLWGYFLYMAAESLPGSMFWERILLIFTEDSKRSTSETPSLPSFVDTVPMSTIRNFTIMQIAALGVCYGITWAGIGGISFPIFIMLLVPFRYFVLGRFFEPEHLRDLDPLEDDTQTLEGTSTVSQ